MNLRLRSGLAFLLALLLWLPTSASAAPVPVNVMAPLRVDDWNAFTQQAHQLKAVGVEAVSVDVWWGDVERQQGKYDWSYYDKVFSTLSAAGLKIAPIMSFHACGGNVGDTYNAPLPSFIWSAIAGQRVNGVVTDPKNVMFQSEHGNTSEQVVSLWADHAVLPIQNAFMKAFETHFAGYAGSIQEISISGGPAGEIRYPSYDAHDGGKSGWPTRGALQAYSPLARADFRRWALSKYGGLAGVNAAWGLQLTSVEDIRPPQDGDRFYDNKGYLGRYGRDLYAWHNESLAQHAKRIILNADSAFQGAFAGIPLGVKIPGVHWQMDEHAPYQRVAEMNAGIIPSYSAKDGEYNDKNGNGYARLIDTVHNAEMRLRRNATRAGKVARRVVLHFTCLEMNDDPGNGYSKAYALATSLGQAARRRGVILKGENALPIGNPNGWGNALRHLANDGYHGINILRMGTDLDVGALGSFIRQVPQAPQQRARLLTSAAQVKTRGTMPKSTVVRPVRTLPMQRVSSHL